ncbi:hypothetical protein JR064_02045 [Xanthomonas sp. CFBP 8703]|uniref:Uncharacterized protein n=1 Tax=Xanthomonas bonasiae TaxID=2810351 RepID=A0ABS3AX46_9XANT|nr:hypothetical protein [Xanthomonas bonasiae]MBN6100943.1 hypothetical protein [Xanthomonas bonasiae]
MRLYRRLIRPDPTRSDPIRSDPIRSDPTRPDPTRPDPTRSDATRRGRARHAAYRRAVGVGVGRSLQPILSKKAAAIGNRLPVVERLEQALGAVP